MKNDSKFKELYAFNLRWAESHEVAYAQTLSDLGLPIARICIELVKEFGDGELAESLIDHMIEMDFIHELEENYGIEV